MKLPSIRWAASLEKTHQTLVVEPVLNVLKDQYLKWSPLECNCVESFDLLRRNEQVTLRIIPFQILHHELLVTQQF